MAAYGQVASDAAAETHSTSGTVASAGGPLADYDVTLFSAGASSAVALGSATTVADGSFSITYEQPPDPNAVLYLRATEASPATGARTLWSVLGPGPAPAAVVVNEATTVATAYAMAQFTDGSEISGPSPGLPNAASMAHDLADVGTGALSPVLLTSPNGGDTRTRDTFNSLANTISACIEAAPNCETLFDAATSPEGTRPGDTFAALVDVAHDPWHNIPEVFAVSTLGSAPAPAGAHRRTAGMDARAPVPRRPARRSTARATSSSTTADTSGSTTTTRSARTRTPRSVAAGCCRSSFPTGSTPPARPTGVEG